MTPSLHPVRTRVLKFMAEYPAVHLSNKEIWQGVVNDSIATGLPSEIKIGTINKVLHELKNNPEVPIEHVRNGVYVYRKRTTTQTSARSEERIRTPARVQLLVLKYMMDHPNRRHANHDIWEGVMREAKAAGQPTKIKPDSVSGALHALSKDPRVGVALVRRGVYVYQTVKSSTPQELVEHTAQKWPRIYEEDEDDDEVEDYNEDEEDEEDGEGEDGRILVLEGIKTLKSGAVLAQSPDGTLYTYTRVATSME